MKREDLVNATNMSAFTMYIDDMTKLNVLKKLKELGIVAPKGPFAPTIRVLLNKFAAGEISVTKEEIEAEYLLTAGKNKRSVL